MNTEPGQRTKLYFSYDSVYDEVYQTSYGVAFTFCDEDELEEEGDVFWGYVIDQTAFA